MPDIFGRTEAQYTFREDLRANNALEDYERRRHSLVPFANHRHDFNAFGSGPPVHFRSAGEAASAFGYVTNNMLQIMSYIDEIMYTAIRLPRYLTVNSAIDPGATSYGYRVLRRTGMAEPIAADGSGAPTAAVSGTLVTNPLTYYGIIASWTLDEARGAMLGNFPLPTATLDAAIQGAIDRLQKQSLVGQDGVLGLFNQPIAGDLAVTHNDQAAGSTIGSDLDATGIRSLINSELSALIEDSEEVFGGLVNSGAAVFLPGPQYDRLSDLYIGDDARLTVLRCLMEDNPWTNFTGNPVSFERALELKGIAPGNADRMVTTIRDMRVAEVGVSIEPRLIRLQDDMYCIKGPVESKHGNAWIKRPTMVRYRDKV